MASSSDISTRMDTDELLTTYGKTSMGCRPTLLKEDVPYFFSTFAYLKVSFNIAMGISRFRLAPSVLGHALKMTWSEIVNQNALILEDDCCLENFENLNKH